MPCGTIERWVDKLSVDEVVLLEFFECLPVQTDDDVAWIYNDSAYEVVNGVNALSFAIMPAYRDVRILLRVNGAPLYELNAVGVDDVKHHK